MSDRNFEALWRATEAPASDLGFALAVEARVARRRMQFDIAGRFGAAAMTLAALLALWPIVLARADALVDSLDAVGPALAAAAVLGAAMVWLTREPADDAETAPLG
jgi:hypothetical protein